MTGRDDSADDRLREALAEAADRWDRTASPNVGWHDGLLDALLPVVRAYGDLRAAEELRAVAKAMWAPDGSISGRLLDEHDKLNARADALTAREEAGR